VTSELIDPLYLAACTTGVGFAHWRVWACTVPAFAANRHSRARTLLAVAGWMLLALAAPAGLLMALVGIEELAGTPLVPERIALATFGLTALQLLAGLATFAAAAWRTRGNVT
jgi:hypothetical protein